MPHPWLASLALATFAAPLLANDPPNVVYVMADELGYYELSHMGHPHIVTPRLDRMAEEGMRFTQFLAGAPLCAPTRCTWLTGKHTGHTSVRTNGGGTPLRADEVTIASVLKERGYATGGFGKWGCGGRGSTGVPEEHGFDTFFGYYDQVHAHTYYPPYLIENSREVVLGGNAGGRSGAVYAHYVIFQRAMRFIRENRERPFFCYLPITPPHGMFDLPEDDPAWRRYENEPWPLEARRYAAMVTMLDRQVGELLDLLDELELAENTVVFFSGDNGGNDYFRDERHPRGFHAPNVDPKTGKAFRGHKGNLYEGGLRVPMIARWPGRIAAGTVSDHLGSFPDVFPTLAELAGARIPDDVDGLSIVPTLLGESKVGRAQERHDHLYWELGGQRALRQGSWKALRRGERAKWELYDLAEDIEEANDLADLHAPRLAAMIALAEAAHEPAREGTFADRTLHEKDRRAKGTTRSRRDGPLHSLPTAGALSNAEWKVLSVSSESTTNERLARLAIDGDPRTHWHSRFGEELARHPHELVIDLGRTCTIRGFRYLARQDGSWNGAFGACTFTVSDDAESFGEPDVSTTFRKTKEAQEVTCSELRGRYVRVRVLSEVNGGPWASAAEIGILGDAEVPPLYVFLLAGQSNMEGQGVVDLDHEDHYNGGKGTLVRLLAESNTKERYAHLRDAEGRWVVRDDVFVRYRTPHELKKGGLSIGYAVYPGKHHIGPELQFGHVLGDHLEAKVLLVKTCWGGKSLHRDFRPPSAGGIVGPCYEQMLAELEEALANVDREFPELAGRPQRIAGFVWFQGWNDLFDEEARESYADNLVHLVHDVRVALKDPRLPVVIGELGNGGADADPNMQAIRRAQARAAERILPPGSAVFIETHDFARPAEDSPNVTHGHHWFGNAESYFLIGDALGKAMVERLAR